MSRDKEIRHAEIMKQLASINFRLNEIVRALQQQPLGTLQYNQTQESPLNLQRQYRPSSPYQQESPVTEPHPAHGNEVMEAMKEQHREALT